MSTNNKTKEHDIRPIISSLGIGNKNIHEVCQYSKLIISNEFCQRCGRCTKQYYCKAHIRIEDDEVIFNKDECDQCGACVALCPDDKEIGWGFKYDWS